MARRRARFVKRYSVAGSAFMRFEHAETGAIADVRVKTRGDVFERYTRREAAIVAADRFAGSPATWSVVCEDYATEPTTLASAEARAAEILALGACSGSHVLRSGEDELSAR